MKVLFINNQGGGFADYLSIDENTTVEKFFNQKLPNEKSEDYLIRVNRQPVPRDYVLQDGDRITVSARVDLSAGSCCGSLGKRGRFLAGDPVSDHVVSGHGIPSIRRR